MEKLNRSDIRKLKKAKTVEERQYAALVLLARSVKWQHKKLAHRRLADATALGVSIPPEILKYFKNTPGG